MSTTPPDRPPPPRPDILRAIGAPPRIDSSRLFGSAHELHIEHRGEVYRLRKTALGKLILTK